MDQTLLVQTRVLLHGMCTAMESKHCFLYIIQLHSTLQSYICKALVRAKRIIIIYHIIHAFLAGLKPALYIIVQCMCVYMYNTCTHCHLMCMCT